jgi:hypothetical protein
MNLLSPQPETILSRSVDQNYSTGLKN